MNNNTNSEMQLIDKDGVNKLGIDSSNQAKVIDETIKTNGTAIPAKSTLIGGSDGTNIRPIKTDTAGRIITSGELVSPYASAKVSQVKVLAVGEVSYKSTAIAAETALKEFHIGSVGACEGTIAKSTPTAKNNLGLFNSSGEVAAWTDTSVGDSLLSAWAYSTAQFTEGTGSARKVFTKSDVNNYPEISYNFPTPIDLSGWRYVRASARVTVATGGVQSRKIQIILTSGTAKRIWEISGTTTTAPFSTEQWLEIIGEITAPTSTAGTGVFDINNVDQISLKLIDGGNKAGTIYWDNAHLLGQIEIIEKIYSAQGTTNQLVFNPSIIFAAGETLMLISKNNGSLSSEVQISTSGVLT